VGAGDLTGIHVGGFNGRFEFLITGDPLEQVGMSYLLSFLPCGDVYIALGERVRKACCAWPSLHFSRRGELRVLSVWRLDPQGRHGSPEVQEDSQARTN